VYNTAESKHNEGVEGSLAALTAGAKNRAGLMAKIIRCQEGEIE
jgi:hypothetical protein